MLFPKIMTIFVPLSLIALKLFMTALNQRAQHLSFFLVLVNSSAHFILCVILQYHPQFPNTHNIVIIPILSMPMLRNALLPLLLLRKHLPLCTCMMWIAMTRNGPPWLVPTSQ